MQGRTATVDGIPMVWHEHGTGVPAILVHGIPAGPALWRHVVPLVEGARCFAFEMVGYGSSIPAGEGRDISVGRQADYLHAWARGRSASNRPCSPATTSAAAWRRCRRAATTASAATSSSPTRSATTLWPIPGVKAMRAAEPLLEHLPDALGRQILHTLMIRGHDDTARGDESPELHWRHYAAHGGAAALIRQIDALDVNDTMNVADTLPKLGVPARIAWSAADGFRRSGTASASPPT